MRELTEFDALIGTTMADEIREALMAVLRQRDLPVSLCKMALRDVAESIDFQAGLTPISQMKKFGDVFPIGDGKDVKQ